jgi:hypothetical protein
MATMSYNRPEGGAVASGQAKSAASILAIVSAIVSFVLSARGREFMALFAAIVAIGAGLLGGLRAMSPRVSGGILSILAVLLGVVAILVAVIALLIPG